MLLEGKVALIVGIEDEVGSITAKTMAQEGAKIVLGDRESERGEALAQEIIAVGGEAIFHEIDITLNRHQQALIERIVREYGRLDLVFNNVSMDGDYFPLARQEEFMVAAIIDVNFNGMWLSMKYQIEQMLKNGGGVIVNNISSFKEDGAMGCSIYRATKSAVATLTEGAAVEYAQNNIRINAISPGKLEKYIREPDPFDEFEEFAEFDGIRDRFPAPVIVPMGRGAKFQEVADTVIWLFSDRASFITGQIVNVDGGIQASRG